MGRGIFPLRYMVKIGYLSNCTASLQGTISACKRKNAVDSISTCLGKPSQSSNFSLKDGARMPAHICPGTISVSMCVSNWNQGLCTMTLVWELEEYHWSWEVPLYLCEDSPKQQKPTRSDMAWSTEKRLSFMLVICLSIIRYTPLNIGC